MTKLLPMLLILALLIPAMALGESVGPATPTDVEAAAEPTTRTYDLTDLIIRLPEGALCQGAEVKVTGAALMQAYPFFEQGDVSTNVTITWYSEVIDLAETDAEDRARNIMLTEADMYNSLGLKVSESELLGSGSILVGGKVGLYGTFCLTMNVGYDMEMWISRIVVGTPTGTYAFAFVSLDQASLERAVELVLNSVEWAD